MIPIDEFTPQQKATLDLYLMVEAENEYKPMSYTKISAALKLQGIEVGKSTIGRWAANLDFEERLNDHINALVAVDADQRKDLAAAAGDQNAKQTLMTLAENNELLHKSHQLLNHVLDGISDKHVAKGFVTHDDAKLVLSIYKETAGREDRLHDRQAALRSAELIGKADLLKQFGDLDLDIEDAAVIEELEMDIELDEE